jgi:hypothetical protein
LRSASTKLHLPEACGGTAAARVTHAPASVILLAGGQKKIECPLVAGDPKLKYARMTVPTEGVEMKIRRNYKQILQIKISPKSSYF